MLVLDGVLSPLVGHNLLRNVLVQLEILLRVLPYVSLQQLISLLVLGSRVPIVKYVAQVVSYQVGALRRFNVVAACWNATFCACCRLQSSPLYDRPIPINQLINTTIGNHLSCLVWFGPTL